MSNILIITFSDLTRDPRVMRQIMFLKEMHRVLAVGFADPEIDGVDFIPLHYRGPKSLFRKMFLAILLKARQFERVYWAELLVREAKAVLQNRSFDLIVANDLNTLPLAVNLAETCGAKIILDAHEYAPAEYDDQWDFRFFLRNYRHYLCSRYLPKVDGMLTVSQGIAREYSRVYGVSCGVLSNAPFYAKQDPSPVNQKEIRIVYHGGADKSRQLDTLARLMDQLDKRFTLDMILLGSRRYIQKLKRLSLSRPRMRFRNPVPMPEIARVLREYDIGIFLLAPNSLHARLALPNKLFEFIQARLCVAIWPSAEMATLVQDFHCGVVAEDFTIPLMAKALNSLEVEQISYYKQQAHKAAKKLCAERNRQVLLKLVNNILG